MIEFENLIGVMIQVFCLLFILRRKFIFSPFALLNFFWLGNSIFLLLTPIIKEEIEKSGWGIISYAGDESRTSAIDLIATQCVICAIATMLANAIYMNMNKNEANSEKLGKSISRFASKIINANQISIIEFSVAVLCGMVLIFHMSSLNWDLAWLNNEYLLMNSGERIGFSSVGGQIIHKGLGFIAALSYVLTEILIRKKGGKLICLMPGAMYLYGVLFSLAQCSRWAPLLLCLPLYYFIEKRQYTVAISILLGVLLSFCMVIEGRSSSKLGFARIPTNMEAVIENPDVSLLSMGNNIFFGGQVVAEAMEINEHQYPFTYKLLSFSPLASIIDGFDKYRGYEIRVSIYVPYNCIAEAWSMGVPWLILYFISIFLWVLLSSLAWQLSNSKFTWAMIFSFILFLNSEYPIRNCFRFQLIMMAATIYAIYYYHKPQEKPNNIPNNII